MPVLLQRESLSLTSEKGTQAQPMKAWDTLHTFCPLVQLPESGRPGSSRPFPLPLVQQRKLTTCFLPPHFLLPHSLDCAPAPASAASEAPALLKEAAKDKKVAAPDLVKALLALEKASRAGPAPSDAALLQGLGGTKSPGRMWRLVFTTNGKTVRALPFGAPSLLDWGAVAKATAREGCVRMQASGWLAFLMPHGPCVWGNGLCAGP